MSAIVEFLEGNGPDDAARTIDDVLAFDDRALEYHHDFIQWLFPLPERSGAVPNAPVLSAADIAALKASPSVQRNLARAAKKLADFYQSTDHWLGPTDHNHLRITRIIKSLRLLASDAAADAFRERILKRVDATAAPISQTSLRYWSQA